MKSILIVIYAHYVKLIIDGKKTVEVRRNKNLANAIKKLIAEQGGCWVYIYVAKSTPELYVTDDGFVLTDFELGEHYKFKCLLNGKVVARFWCDKVEDLYICQEIIRNGHESFGVYDCDKKLLKNSCLSSSELFNYLYDKRKDNGFGVYYDDEPDGYAIHISKLEVLKEPLPLFEFYNYCKCYAGEGELRKHRLTKAPKNYCYIESEK